MTLEQKAAFLNGAGQWNTHSYQGLGIPAIIFADGPGGIRRQAGSGDHLGIHPSLPATCYPSAATLANSWDEDLLCEIGDALGEEAREKDVQVLLGPGLNIKRNPLCGRNFEYFSEDPYLSGKLAAAEIRGIQQNGVSACPKHFAVNSQETRRMAMNVMVDERTLREIYLTGFEIAVREGTPRTLMSSYNRVNGIYANENPHLLQEILRGEWGYQGAVVTDWGGSNDPVEAVRAGSTLEMPYSGYDSARRILQAVREGKLREEELDQRVQELLALVDATTGSSPKPEQSRHSAEKRHLLAQKAARESAVLLKNENHILPLRGKEKVAVIGDFAFTPRYQGAGSSLVNTECVDTVIGLLPKYPLEVAASCRGYRRDGAEDRELTEQAVAAAKAADVVLFFAGLNESSESEGIDRTHLRIPENQIRLLEELQRVNLHIICILSAGSVIEMPWEPGCEAILWTGLGGEAGAGAVLDLLTGKATPGGKLSETFPMCYRDTPSYPYFQPERENAEYREGIYVGYRYFDCEEKPVRYPFGYGLSYTTFAYDGLQVDAEGVSLNVTNAGEYDGAEIVQLYVSLPGSRIPRPVKELKGFQKVFLRVGETKKIRIPLDDKAFRYWNTETNHWEIESGTYEILISASAADIRLRGELTVTGTEKAQMKDSIGSDVMPREVFSGGEKTENGGKLKPNAPLSDLQYAPSGFWRWIGRQMERRLTQSLQNGKPDLNLLFQYNMPFRAMAKMTGGMVSLDMTDAMVMIVNGRGLRGTGRLVRGFFRNLRENRRYRRILERQNELQRGGYDGQNKKTDK